MTRKTYSYSETDAQYSKQELRHVWLEGVQYGEKHPNDAENVLDDDFTQAFDEVVAEIQSSEEPLGAEFVVMQDGRRVDGHDTKKPEDVRQDAYVTGFMVGFKAARGFGDFDDADPSRRDAVEICRMQALEEMGPLNAKRWLDMKNRWPGAKKVKPN